MSFLSRKPARPDGRGRGDEYDGYADDGYAMSDGDDDRWSPNEYFSPEGIKGKWAGESPDGRSGGRGRRDAPSGPGRNSHGSDLNGPGHGGTGNADGTGYGADEFAQGLYDLPDGADDDRGDRRRSRRSKDREDRGERTGILRLRRDRGEDIWPDDGISDEDYWASVAADRPLNGNDSPAGNGAAPGARSRAGSRPGMDSRAGADARFGGDQRGGDQRGGDQRGGERGATGRLGPPPGLTADYKPGGGTPGGPGQGGRAGSDPMPARPVTGPHTVRVGTGPAPTVGVTSSRPPAGPNGARPGLPKSGAGSGGFPRSPARPSFQPSAGRSGSGGLPSAAPSGGHGGHGGEPGGGRQQDWGDRTERIERVNASGYPDPRSAGRGQGPGPAGGPRTSGPLGAPGRGRGDNPAWRAPDRQAPDRRTSGREASGPWPATAPARARDDDPLTSKAYSRAAMAETDGRSYRVAARRSQEQAKLTEQAETFIGGQYQQPAQRQPGRGGEYWQYRDDAQAPALQSPGGRQPLPGDQGGHPGLAAGPAPTPGRATQPAFTPGNPARPGLPEPGSGLPGGPYEGQQRAARSQMPAAGLPAPGPSGGPAGHTGNGPGGGRAAGTGGLNPYDSAVTGSYPYSSQVYPAPSALDGLAQNGAGDPYYRASATAGYPADGYPGASQGRADQARRGYGGYPAPGDRRY